MVKFDSDNALFCTLAAEIIEPGNECKITYVNPAGKAIFGDDLEGMLVMDLFEEILCSVNECSDAFSELMDKGSIIIEGKLRGRDVQLHSMVDMEKALMQAAIMDTTESHRAKEGFVYTAGALARASEVNDDTTGSHIIRINSYAGALAGLLGESAEFVESISLLAQLHDVGKMHISETILKKPGPLTHEEYEIMKLHTTYGAKIIGDHPRLTLARQIALTHHEKWDGSGYPGGLSGEMIPLSAQITAIVDVFDALISPRPYKEALTCDEVLKIMTKGDNRTNPERDFSPRVYKAFIDHFTDFTTIYERLKD